MDAVKRLWLLASVLAIASFGVYWLASHPENSSSTPVSLELTLWGLASEDGNATSAFFLFNASHSLPVEIVAFDRPMPRQVWIWSSSDQSRFGNFSLALSDALASNGIALSKTHGADLSAAEPGVLIVASSAMPADLVRNDTYIGLLERGWVILYAGFPPSLMEAGGQIVPNPSWAEQRLRLGVDLDEESAVSGYRITTRSVGSVPQGPWTVVPHSRGWFVVFPGLLDASFSDADAAALAFSDFVRYANWTRPIAALSANVSNGSLVRLPLAAGVVVREAWIWTHANGTARRIVPLHGSANRLIHSASWRAGRPLSVAYLLNQSRPTDLRLTVYGGNPSVRSTDLGRMPAGISWHSSTLPFSLGSGDFVLELSNSDGPSAYSILRLFSYRVQIVHVDASTKTIAARLWAGDAPAAGTAFSWSGKRQRTDDQGNFRLVDPDLADGVNVRALDVDGVPVQFEFVPPSSFLSSWPDRLMVMGAFCLFGVAWWVRRHASVRIRLLPPEHHGRRVNVSPALLSRVFQDVPKGTAVSLREFSSRLSRMLADPQLVLPADAVSRILSQASAVGLVVLHGGAVTWRAGHASEQKARESLFWRRLADRLVMEGWTFRRNGKSLTCRRGGVIRVLEADPVKQRIRRSGSTRWQSLDDESPVFR